MRFLTLFPQYRALLTEKAELTDRLAEEVSKRRTAEEMRDVFQHQAEKYAFDYRNEVDGRRDDLRRFTDAITRRFMLQNVFSQAPAVPPSASPQPLKQDARVPVRLAINDKQDEFRHDLEQYFANKQSASARVAQ